MTKKDRKSTRAAVVAAATELFSQRGYPLTSVQDIADAAGLTKGSIYYYFTSKEELLLHIHNEYMDVLMREVEIIRAKDLTPLQKLELVIHASLGLMDDYLPHMRIFLQDWRYLSEEGLQRTRKSRDALEDFITELLEAGAEAGEVRPELNNAIVARGILGMSSWPYLWYRKGPLTTEEIADMYSTLTLAGLKPPLV